MLEPVSLAALVSDETGLSFTATAGKDGDGRWWTLLHPTGLDSKHTFGIRITIGWRRIEIGFEPGSFAAPLLGEMGAADTDGRVVFASILSNCQSEGAEIRLRVNGLDRAFSDSAIWSVPWTRLDLVLRKGNLEIGDLDSGSEIEIVRQWALRFVAAIVAVLPLDTSEDQAPPDNQHGFPEGAVSTVLVNRYERDRRNRAAAIAIHGVNCKGCGMSFYERYGDVALGFIEIHHLAPVSKLGAGYILDPGRDLVPLCSNCHSVVHRRDPPLTVEELRDLFNAST